MSNNLICPNNDINLLSPNGFVFQSERIPHVSYFSTSIQLPDISLGGLDIATRHSTNKIPGDKMEYQPLDVPFMVDEEMKNYIEIYKWMTGLTHPQEHPQYTRENATRNDIAYSEVAKNYADAQVLILNSHNNVICTFNFIDCFPTNLSGINFDNKNTDVTYATSSATFEYTYFYIS